MSEAKYDAVREYFKALIELVKYSNLEAKAETTELLQFVAEVLDEAEFCRWHDADAEKPTASNEYMYFPVRVQYIDITGNMAADALAIWDGECWRWYFNDMKAECMPRCKVAIKYWHELPEGVK